jgi:cell division protein FtsB
MIQLVLLVFILFCLGALLVFLWIACGENDRLLAELSDAQNKIDQLRAYATALEAELVDPMLAATIRKCHNLDRDSTAGGAR